jgi:hypothetical protein
MLESIAAERLAMAWREVAQRVLVSVGQAVPLAFAEIDEPEGLVGDAWKPGNHLPTLPLVAQHHFV